MKCLVLGYVRRSGVAKATKRAFDFAQLLATNAVEVVASENFQQAGEGFDKLEIPLEIAAIEQFKGLKFPAVMELKMGHRAGPRGQLETICVGIARPAATAAA